ncbi:MAG: acetyl-CoA carboxylase carboxyltransferase subunit alpha [Phycisphaerales bacterium]|nr:acetyl-CoA carboxylase carboxyltransferase subunit alpha [Phycisphaerales bacterium]
MLTTQNRQFLEFEKNIKEILDQIEETKNLAVKNKTIDYTPTIKQLALTAVEKRRELTSNLTPWQRVQLSRHPDRPYALKLIEKMSTNFVELHGDRNYKDDKAMIGGFAQLDGETMMFIGQQKGTNTKSRQLRNFGMANPEGYRKALRLMKLADKFNKPIITLVDTPGAFPGIEAEERGQGEAIARNIYEMFKFSVPIIVVVIGEGASGGALGIGVGDRVLMLENTWYSVISPESCSSILWRSWDKKATAAEQLKLTATDMLKNGLIEEIVPEPFGGSHWDYDETAQILKKYIKKNLTELQTLDSKTRIDKRIERYNKLGHWIER